MTSLKLKLKKMWHIYFKTTLKVKLGALGTLKKGTDENI